MRERVHAYRASLVEGGTHAEILIACYDALAEDIRDAGRAAARSDIVQRCRHSQRALMLLGHLQSWVSLLDDATLQSSLTEFYEYLRAQLLRLQSSLEEEKFLALAMLVCETRAAWQKKQSSALPVSTDGDRHVEEGMQGEQRRFCCSA